MKIAVFQQNSTLGAIKDNAQKIINTAQTAQKQGADILITPELSICGYPAHDLLLNSQFIIDCDRALIDIAKQTSIPTLVGYPKLISGKLFNVVSLVHQANILNTITKNQLSDRYYFSENKYFQVGSSTSLIEFNNYKIALQIGDINSLCPEIPLADLIINITASPYYIGKTKQNIKINKPLVIINCAGGQDELVFEGGSRCINRSDEIAYQMPMFNEDMQICEFNDGNFSSLQSNKQITQTEEIYCALVVALRDYLHKNKISKVVIGLSGGIDSAVVAAIAVAAIGNENVQFVFMPTQYTSKLSERGAQEIAKNLACQLHNLPINNIFEQVLTDFKPFAKKQSNNSSENLTEQNIQARLRGLTLMAFANEFGALVINTSNRSEGAMGYGTLYGDLVGGYALIKDLYKFQVYEVANYINRINGEIIPEFVITRPPSAELRPNQKDSDSLPDYPVLDEVLQKFLDDKMNATELINEGYDKELIKQIISLYHKNEYKRRQFPLGLNILSDMASIYKTPATNNYKEL